MHRHSQRVTLQRLIVVVALVWGAVFQPVSPQDSCAQAAQPDIGFGIALTGPGGIYCYVPDKWGVLQVHLVNRGQVPLELLAATYFEQQPTLQYGRKIWIPPRSRMITWHPARFPSAQPDGSKVFKFQSLVMNADQAREVLIRSDSGQMQHDGILEMGDPKAVTGFVGELDTAIGGHDSSARELVLDCREAKDLPRRMTTLSDPICTPGEESLGSLQQLVISNDRLMHDAAGMASIRRWLFGGGRLWVMLDRVDPRFLEMLLGDELRCEVVDRVGLTTIRIEPGHAATQMGTTVEEREQPVDLVRVLVSDVDVAYVTDGWPAAFWKNCGEGRLLVTTLGANGWMGPPKRRSVPIDGPGPPVGVNVAAALPVNVPEPKVTSHRPNEPMLELATEFLADRAPDAMSTTVLEPIAQEYIGYAVPARWLISGLLLGFSGALAGLGIWLWRSGRLEWLGVLGPALSIIVSLVLVLVGRQNRQSVPPTVAAVQFAQAIVGTDDVLVQGQMGLFSPDPGQASLGSRHGGMLVPDMSGLEGTTRRMIWTDVDHWQWQNLPLTAGSRGASFSQSSTLTEPLTAEATFGPEGLKGRLATSGRHPPEDAIIATVGGRIGVQFNADGTFAARTDQVFSHEQFLAAELLSDEQIRRRRVLQHLLANPQRIDYPHLPLLLFWTTPWDLGFQLPPDSRSLGAMLVAVPLKLQRPPAGTVVTLPSPLLPFSGVISKDYDAAGGMWDRRRREWMEKASPSAMWLKFQLPRELLPVEPGSGHLVVQVIGPMGRFELAGGSPRQPVPLKTWINPVGTLSLDITDPAVLQPDADGGVLLRITGGDPDRPELTLTQTKDGPKTNYWRIESLSLELTVKTAAVPGGGKN